MLKPGFKLNYKEWNIRQKLLIIISFLILMSVSLVSVLSYLRYSSYILNQTTRQTRQIIEQTGINIDTYIDELFRLCLSPYYNSNVMNVLENPASGEQERLENGREIEDFLGSVMTIPRKDILRVYIMTPTNIYSTIKTPYNMEDFNTYQQTDWYKQALTATEPIFLPVRAEKVFGNNKTQIFSVAQRICSRRDNSNVIGVIKVDADYSGIKSICDRVQVESGGGLFIIDDDKNIIYQNSRIANPLMLDTLLEKALTDVTGTDTKAAGERFIIATQRLEVTGWRVVSINAYAQLNKYSIDTRNSAFLLALLCAAAAVIVLVFYINSFLKPLFEVVGLMKKVQNGDMQSRYLVKNKDEIGYLGQSFNKMIDRINEMLERNTQLVREIYQMRYLQKEAQYNALCSQIKPHFLYNTLNTLSLLIKCGEHKKAVEDIGKLSYYLRAVMHTDKDIPLSQELKLADSYLGLQQSRYGEALRYEIRVDKGLMELNIPALTLQPIIENAVVHGCESIRGASVIKIYSEENDSRLLIHVDDNGKGITAETLKTLNDRLRLEYKEQDAQKVLEESVGLINVHRRLRLKYGEGSGLSIESRLGEGTKVTVAIDKNHAALQEPETEGTNIV